MNKASLIGFGIAGLLSLAFAGKEIMFKRTSDEELEKWYEEERLKRNGDVSSTMERINNELIRRANKRYEREHPNAEPRHREHGYYLPNDD